MPTAKLSRAPVNTRWSIKTSQFVSNNYEPVWIRFASFQSQTCKVVWSPTFHCRPMYMLLHIHINVASILQYFYVHFTFYCTQLYSTRLSCCWVDLVSNIVYLLTSVLLTLTSALTHFALYKLISSEDHVLIKCFVKKKILNTIRYRDCFADL